MSTGLRTRGKTKGLVPKSVAYEKLPAARDARSNDEPTTINIPDNMNAAHDADMEKALTRILTHEIFSGILTEDPVGIVHNAAKGVSGHKAHSVSRDPLGALGLLNHAVSESHLPALIRPMLGNSWSSYPLNKNLGST